MSTTNTLDLNNRVNKLEKAVSGGDSAQANKSDIATEFNTTTNYTAGCFVYYQGKLYQFNADHSAGAWDPTDVVVANVTDQVVSNKSAIDGLAAADITYDNTDSGLTATDVQGAVDEVASDLLNSTIFEPFTAPDANPFAEGGSGYLLKVKYNNTILGYLVIRPKGYSGTGGRKIALELFDKNWGAVWEIHRDYPA